MFCRLITFKEAKKIIGEWHSHHKPPIGHVFSLGAYDCDLDNLIGVVIVGRPVSPGFGNEFGKVLEVTRLCTNGYKNAASFLLGCVKKSCKELGVEKLISYTREDENGTCYLAAGWKKVSKVKGKGWVSGNKSDRWLPGLYLPTTEICDRVRWEIFCR
jgi:hypothetical protein